MKKFLESKKSLAVTLGTMLAVAALAVMILVVPRLSADVTSTPGSIIPATALNYFTNVTISATTGFTNTTLVPEAPAGYLAVKREFSLQGTNQVNLTSIPAAGAGATNTLTSGILYTTNDMISAWYPLQQTPYYDVSHVYAYSGSSNVTTSFRVRMICVQAPTPQGGNIPSGALGAGNIAVPQ